MSSRVLKIIGLALAFLVVLGVGAAIGGGLAYAAMRVTSRTDHVNASGEVGSESGIVVLRVVPDGPAAEAGVVRGDILLAVDGKAVNGPRDLRSILDAGESGDQVELTVLHGDEERALTATLGEGDDRLILGLMSCGGPLDAPPVEHRMVGSGALIVEVMPDSPAEQAGLREGDHITAVGGQKVDAKNNLTDLIATHNPGDKVTLEVVSPGEESREVVVDLGEDPEEEGRAYLGVRYLSLPRIEGLEHRLMPFRMPRIDLDHDRFPIQPGRNAVQGAVIARIVEDSPAEAAGLRQGDVVTAIDGEVVTSPRSLVDAVAERELGDTITLTVTRSDEEGEREIEVTLAEDPEREGSAYLGVVIGGFFMHRFEDGEIPPDFELPDASPRFRLPFSKKQFDLDLDDLLRCFEFRLPHRNLDSDRLTLPGEVV